MSGSIPPSTALQDAQRMMEELLVPPGQVRIAHTTHHQLCEPGPKRTHTLPPNPPPNPTLQKGQLQNLQAQAATPAPEVITFNSSSNGSGFDPLSSLGGSGSDLDWGGGFGGRRQGALESAITQLSAAVDPDGHRTPDFAAAAQALEQLAVPEVHADDLLGCACWVELCRALPLCLVGLQPADWGGGGSGSGAAAAGEKLACVLLSQRLARTLLDAVPEALAQVLAPLLQRLVGRGVARLPTSVTPIGRQQTLGEQRQEETGPTSQPAAASAAEASGAGSEQAAVVFALRALHALGHQWHFVPDDLAQCLATIIAALALQGVSTSGAAAVASSAAATSNQPGGSSSSSSSSRQLPALQALVQLDPGMLWWHRLLALAVFKRRLIEEPAADGSSGQEAGVDEATGTDSLFAAALLPCWRGERRLTQPWQQAAAAAVTRSLLSCSPRSFTALLGCEQGAAAEEAVECARTWVSSVPADEEAGGSAGQLLNP
jgi:hypothetical protein